MGDGREEFWPGPDDALSPEEKRRREQGSEPEQVIRPKKGKPARIPIPSRDAFMQNLKKVARGRLDKRSPEH